MLSAQNVPDVTALSLEDLMNLQVTSVAKRSQKLADSPAAIFVITQEDIHRSGARNIPEALRVAPGIEVARIDENKWAITARGFNDRFSNKLLVLQDGRSIYTPLFSGVYWRLQDLVLEDVDRIEVIRGPGATLWGANAVNGVINIITKDASATQGSLISVGTGNELDVLASVRVGGKIDRKTYIRGYSKFVDWKSSTDETEREAFDGWHSTRVGFRIDRAPDSEASFTLQGDAYLGRYGETMTAPLLLPPYRAAFQSTNSFSGGNLLGRWNQSLSRSKISLQMYYDRTNTGSLLLVNHQNIYDVDFQHDIRVTENHDLIWGAGYRSLQDAIDSSPYAALVPNHRNRNLFSGFVQDDFALAEPRLRLTLGSKFERNDFTGFEVEPNARMLWTVSQKHSIWTAVSRAVRTPARTEEDIQLTTAVTPPSLQSGGLPVQVTVFGNPQFKSEDVIAYEAGYRVRPARTLFADFAGFYNSYSNLLTAEPQLPFIAAAPSPAHVIAPFLESNKRSGTTHGVEAFAEWKALPKLTVSGVYSFLEMDIRHDSDSFETFMVDPNASSPRHQYYLRSSVDLPKSLEHDIILRYVYRLGGLDIPSYYSLDAHVGFKPDKRVELSFGGQNLLNDRHIEFRPDFVNTLATQVKRTFQTTVTVKF
jgi:iron complex outermembrane receptor protein